MKITTLHLLSGARKATGLTVIIDVFRAFSTACYLTAGGAGRILPVGDLETARRLKAEDPDRVLIGERDGRKLPDFEYGNSPTEVAEGDFTNKTVIHTTSAGTQGLVNAVHADEVITGSFVNVEAIVAHIQARSPSGVSLVCMGTGAITPNMEDTLCARYIADRLQNRPADSDRIRRLLRKSAAAGNFLDPEVDWAPARDFELCTEFSRFDFVLEARKGHDGRLELTPPRD